MAITFSRCHLQGLATQLACTLVLKGVTTERSLKNAIAVLAIALIPSVDRCNVITRYL